MTRWRNKHFRTPTILPVLAGLCCAFLAGPWTGRDPVQYKVAGVLIGIGFVLWVVTVSINRGTGAEPVGAAFPGRSRGPVN